MTPKRQQKAAKGNTKATKRHQKGKTTAAEKAIHWQQKGSNRQQKQQGGIKKGSRKAPTTQQKGGKKVAQRQQDGSTKASKRQQSGSRKATERQQ